MSLIYAADDCEATRRFYGWALGKKNKVELFPDGPSMLKAIELQPPDLVISDLNMPWMSGYEVVAEVKTKHPDIPVIIATCMEGEAHEVAAHESGCIYWFKCNKSSELEELVSCTLIK